MGRVPSHRILVLNRLWQPVNIVGVKRGFSLLCQDYAQVIHTSEGTFEILDFGNWVAFSEEYPPTNPSDSIQTVRLSLRIPKVLLLRIYDRLPIHEMKFNRQNLFERDGFRCQYCTRAFLSKDLNLDHVVPRDRGGPTTWENIVCSCIPCNTQKGNRTPNEAKLRLIKLPRKPKWRPFIQVSFGVKAHDCWKHFIDVAYWNVELGEEKR